MKKMTSFAYALIALAALSFELHAKLPAPSPEAKEAAVLASAKTAYGDKVAAYKLCQAQNKVAKTYAVKAKVVDMPACVEPGEFKAPETVSAVPVPTAVATQPVQPEKK
jgi:hypothetical protein